VSIATIREPTQRRSRETSDAIINATLRLLERSPFESLAIGDITREAGISVGGFYARFHGKEALLVHLVKSTFAEPILDEVDELLSPQNTTERSARDVIAAYLTFVARAFERHRPVLRPLSLLSREGVDAELRQLVLEANRRIHARFVAVLETKSAEMRHPQPAKAIRVGLMWSSAALRESVLYQEPVSELSRGRIDSLVEELVLAFAAYLGLEDER
jgi:AcrR family transcriptional regulator